MKTRYLMLLLGCLFLQLQSIFSQTENNSLYIPPTDCAVGSLAAVPIMLSNDAEIVALQFDLHIPDVVQLANPGITLTDRKNGHTITVKNLGGNNYRVLVFSATNTSLRGNSGALFQLPLSIPKDLEVGTVYAVEFKDVVLSKRNGENVQSGVNDGSIKIVHGNRPDIAVQEIKFISSEIKPGGKVSVAWSVKNVGNQPTKAGWSEQVYLVSEAGDEAYLGPLNSEKLLSASGVASRQEEFTLPVYPGIDGKVYAKVKLTPYPESGELPVDVANNEASSEGYLTLAKELYLRLNSNPIEETSTFDVYGFLNRSGSRKVAETFTFTNSDPKRMTLPSSVTIPVGESGISFKVRVIDDQIANPDSFIVAKVSSNGYKELSQEIWIEDNEMPKLTVTAPEDDRKEGDSFKLTIQREWATKWPLAVHLVTDHPKRFQFDPNVVIPVNEKSVTVDILAVDDDLPDVTIDAVFTASAYGFENGTGFVKLLDNDLPEIQMEITPLSFSESVGPQAAIATLRRTKVTDNKITVKLTDDSKEALYYPSSIVLEKGVTEYQFSIGVVDNDLKDGDRKVKLSAAVYISSCSCSAAGTSVGAVSKELVILDDDGPTLKVTSSQSSLIEGKEKATILTISRNTNIKDALVVKLSCDRPKEVVFNSEVVIPAGKTSIDIPVSAKENSTIEGNRTITFTVLAEGFSKGVCWAMITDQTLPDAVVIGQKIPSSDFLAKSNILVELTIGNKGAIVLPSQTKVAVYLTNNVQLSSASYKMLLGYCYTQNSIVPGQVETLKKTFDLPDKTGDYYIISSVNDDQGLKELIYTNNVSEPISVNLNALYRIQVSTDKSIYKPGEAIVITGQAFGGTVSKVPVDLYIINDGYRQSFDITTDPQGVFQYVFKPENWQMGHFAIGACYPGENLKDEMVYFDLYGLRKISSERITCETVTNKVYNGEIKLLNPGMLKLTNIQVELISAPANCKVVFEPIVSINANGTGILKYTITGTVPSDGTDWEQIKARISTTEGAVMDLFILYYCRSEKGVLISENSSVNTTMTKGASRDYPLYIKNTGNGETGKITVNIPNVPWMSLSSPREIASLKSEETAVVLLHLEPTDDLVLNVPIKGMIGVNCSNGNGFSIPFNIVPVSEHTGTLKVDVCDEYTYSYSINPKEAPHVSNAKIRVTTPTNKLVTEGVTGKDGLYTLHDLPEGYYNLEVTEEKHSDVYKGSVLISPGESTLRTVNLSFNAIKCSFAVEETEVTDEYEIFTTVEFETNVPVPVVVMNLPDRIAADELQPGESLMFNVTLINKGLITAEDVQLIMPAGFNSFVFEPMIQDPFDLKSQVSVTIPVKVTRNSVNLRVGHLDNDPCVAYPGTLYYWDCGVDRKEHRYGRALQLGACRDGIPPKPVEPTTPPHITVGPSGGSFGGGIGGSIGGWAGGYSEPQNTVTGETVDRGCEPCQNRLLGVILMCPVNIPVWSCLASSWQCGENIAEGNMTGSEVTDCVLSTVGCAAEICETATNAGALLDPTGTTAIVNVSCRIIGRIAQWVSCFKNIGEAANDKNCDLEATPASLRSSEYLSRAKSISYIKAFWNQISCGVNQLTAESDIMKECFGSDVWNNCSVDDLKVLVEYIKRKGEYVDLKDDDLLKVKPEAISVDDFQKFIERLNNTTKKAKGESVVGDNFISQDLIQEKLTIMRECEDQAKDLGYSSIGELMDVEYNKLLTNLTEAQNSVCSSITLQFKQTMTMTRQAFRGTLTVFNGHESIAMKDVRLNLEVKDEEGNTATTHEFQINTESLDTFGGELDGAWTLDAQKTGKATILFIPTKYAAPTEEKNYSFGGTLSYVDPFTDLVVTRDLFPVTMTVKPSPSLDMTYFMQRDILGDDPLTTNKVEPKVPAEFSLLIHNTGAGDATNVNMVTNQPKITYNKKDLNIKFELSSSQLNGEDHSLALGGSVATAFGTIEAGKTSYAQWWFTSTLLGQFTNYDVKATHVSSYDNQDLSLLKHVTIHELIRSIKVPKTDLAGFLVNDIEDSEDLPDMLYLSDGTIEKVSVTKKSAIQSSGTYQYTLTVTPSESGWNYGSINDPTNGRQTLVRIVRKSDGTAIDARNIWQTSCTLRDGKAFYENIIHFVDKMGTAQEEYQLTFEPGPSVVLEVSSFEGIPAENETVDKPVTEVTLHFNKEVKASTFTTEDLTLVLQGETQDASLIKIQKIDDLTFVLDLAALTKRDGYYILTVQTASITDAEGYEGDSGKSANWVQYLAAGSQTLTLSLAKGWNWISTNMEEVKDPVTFLSPVKDRMKRLQNQYQELINDPKYGLTGNLKTLIPESSYKLEMNGDGQIDVTGTVFAPDQVTIDLNKGWNWISYIPRAAASPTKALSLLSANANDEIKGQRGFARFNGTSWVGTLKQMAPGEGYMYYANTKQSFHYAVIYNTLQAAYGLRSESEQTTPWSVDIHKYPNNMSIVADLWENDVKQEPDAYTVGAFVGEECRGIGEYVDGMIFLTVYGEKNGENISFRAIKAGSSTEWSVQETISFGDVSQGTLTKPYALHLSGLITGIDTWDNSFSIYPNPVGRILYFKGDYLDIKNVSILNINGVTILRKDMNGENSLDVSSLSDGVYILIIKKENETLYRKIVKVNK